MTNEEKAHEFLNYIAQNEKELKKALKKNITFDKEIFDDVFQDTIIKVYNSIMKNGTTVGDYKQYFFMASKWTYVLFDNRNKKYKSNAVRDYFDNNDIIDDDTKYKEDRFTEALKLINKIRIELNNIFGETHTEIYLNYSFNKANEGASYKSISEKYNITTNQMTKIMKDIRDYIKSNEELNKLYKSIKQCL